MPGEAAAPKLPLPDTPVITHGIALPFTKWKGQLGLREARRDLLELLNISQTSREKQAAIRIEVGFDPSVGFPSWVKVKNRKHPAMGRVKEAFS